MTARKFVGRNELRFKEEAIIDAVQMLLDSIHGAANAPRVVGVGQADLEGDRHFVVKWEQRY